jgi:hypothetical protein
MRDPSLYPGAPQEVELRETHASWVFLAGELAFKVKKPVTFPFLDYGTLERRREMCGEEVRLNRRLAPGYYLGVNSIVRRHGRYSLAAEGDPEAIEYAVRMKRVPEERTLERLAARGELRRDHVDAVARRLADFHHRAPAAPLALRELGPLIDTLRENVATLTASGAPAIDEGRVGAAAHFTETFVERRRGRLAGRAERGWIRECHGDLRAEHVIVEDGIAIYDCVEFNPSLSNIDVSADLAFLVMDLARLGEWGHAERLVDSYRGAGGDPGDGPLVAFYAAYRAWVRSKVACLRVAGMAPGDLDRGRNEEQARALLDLGHRFAWRARLPLALVVCGPPASGKTHLAGWLTRVSGLRHLSSDLTRKRLAGVEPSRRAPAEAYSEDFSRRTYAELARLAGEELGRSGGVIVDATFRRRADRDGLARALEPTGAPLFFARCDAPRDLLFARARERGGRPGTVSDADQAVVERLIDRFEPLEEVAPGLRATVPTDRPASGAVAELEARLDRLL